MEPKRRIWLRRGWSLLVERAGMEPKRRIWLRQGWSLLVERAGMEPKRVCRKTVPDSCTL